MTSRIDLQLRKAKSGLSFLSSGFVALDVLEGQGGRLAAAGGSCGNVTAIMAWLGWPSATIARLGADQAGNIVSEDLSAVGVSLKYLRRENGARTPIVLQRFVQSADGTRRHRFSLVCPECGAWLPRFRSVVLSHAAEVMEGKAPTAFYFDRVSPAIVRTAVWARDCGALVIFEPSSIPDDPLFQRAVETCHILKYSDERLGRTAELAEARQPSLVIHTRGAAGLRVRWRGRWSDLQAFQVPRVLDAAGSGDWCTAGILHVLCQPGSGSSVLEKARKTDVERALRLGQALAAVNCAFEGARGLMYAASRDRLNRMLSRLAGGHGSLPDDVQVERRQSVDLCSLCAEASRGSTATMRHVG